MSTFKYLDEATIHRRYNYNENQNLIQLEIAFQMKRIADILSADVEREYKKVK